MSTTLTLKAQWKSPLLEHSINTAMSLESHYEIHIIIIIIIFVVAVRNRIAKVMTWHQFQKSSNGTILSTDNTLT